MGYLVFYLGLHLNILFSVHLVGLFFHCMHFPLIVSTQKLEVRHRSQVES